jgi:NOL1/NOP2/fmu family ribosome biogenesis protein
MLKSGGMMLYSTCTFNPSENERMILQFLDEHADFEAAPIDHAQFGLSHGRAAWVAGDQRARNACARLWPHKCDGEGHFMALMRKKPDSAVADEKEQPKKKKIDGFEYFEKWCSDYLLCELKGNLALRKNALYLEPYDMPDLHGIHAYKTGLYLGDLKNKRFEPSTTFALALSKDDFKNTVDFPQDAEQVFRYLNGESFDVQANEGYNLFCVEGFPLGFGKVVNGRLKNRRI